jgi:two-component system cell cycle sensor histidine kinase/response regulator CckA
MATDTACFGFDADQTNSSPVVLLVEDEAVVREITGQVLENAGYRVLESSGPREALHVASRHPGRVDLLLTDVVMPEMNGIDLAQQLRTLQPGLVTVFMSGYAEGDLLRSMSATTALHIQKPFTVNFLLSRVAEALNTRAAGEGPAV